MTQQNDPGTSDRAGFLALAALAATLGAGAAILFAPEEGAKTRRRVGRTLESLRGEAAGTIGSLRRELRRRGRQSRRDQQVAGLTGFVLGVGVAALLMTDRGSSARQKLSGTLGRIKVGAVDRLERLRQRAEARNQQGGSEDQPVRSVQELDRDPDSVF
jgi:gas vesicle protein